MTNELIALNDVERMAIAASKSRMFGFGTPEEAMSIMLLCQAEGMHPAIAMRDYHVIKGKPSLKSDAMLARFQAAGGRVEWKEYGDRKVTGIFSHQSGGSLEVTWTIEMADKIKTWDKESGAFKKLTEKDNWRNYSRAMLRARCISEGVRSVFPACVAGIYSSEEVQDFDDKPTVKQMGDVELVAPQAGAATDPTTGEIGTPIYVPGQDEPHHYCASLADWIRDYASLVQRIKASDRFTDEQKEDKLKKLAEANIKVTEQFEDATMTELKLAVARAGGSIDPKGDTSPPSHERPASAGASWTT